MVRKQFKTVFIIFILLCLLLSLVSCNQAAEKTDTANSVMQAGDNISGLHENKQESYASGHDIVYPVSDGAETLSEIPDYSGEPYCIINDNVPYFTEDEITTEYFEYYSELDSLGRCGTAYANICPESMPAEERGEIGSIKPSGWQTVKYDNVDGKYLYNRCHLIGYQLSGENANEKNLITGTRYMNVEGMLPFENMVADYVKETGGHVLYRVTPLFTGDNLLCDGVLMEAMSVEDGGEGILYNVFCYNVQPGISIDYATGDSSYVGESHEEAGDESVQTYVLNTNSKKFHYPDCESVDQISDKNRDSYTGTRSDLIDQGYTPCKNCTP